MRVRAAEHGRGIEAEIRASPDDALKPAARLKMGSALVELFRLIGGIDLDITRDQEAAKPARFD